jgi:RHS repeat-associated protein
LPIIVNHRVFSAYGQLLSQTNPSAGSAVAAVNCLFAYTGEALSAFSENTTTGAVDGLQNNDERWYNAITGRWLSQDPSETGPNLYEYCGNDPTDGTDPSGLQPPAAAPKNEVVPMWIGGTRVGPAGLAGHAFIVVPDGKGSWTIVRAGPSRNNPKVLEMYVGPWVNSVDYPDLKRCQEPILTSWARSDSLSLWEDQNARRMTD